VRIWSVGHGARPIDELLAMLEAAGIRTLVDVRSFPGSRRHPQFGANELAAALQTREVTYAHLRGLGGRREPRTDSPHRALRVAAFRGYADHMDGAEFAGDYGRLIALANASPTAFMCAETLWWRCHRRLIADRLCAEGWAVLHLLSPGKTEPHAFHDAARIRDGHLVYEVGTLAFPA
jgi:uncharacterized protein (DUF488 family)